MPQLDWGHHLRRLFWKPDPGQEIRDEVDHHLALMARDLEDSGLPPDQARAEARRRFGALPDIEKACRRIATDRNRRSRIETSLENMRDDLRYAGRMFRRNPAYTATAAITLAVTIAANTIVFSLVNGVLLLSLPYPAPDELVVVEELRETGDASWELSYPTLQDVRTRATRLDHLGGWLSDEVTLQGEIPSRIPITLVDSGFFPAVQVRPVLGRALTAEDQANGGVAVISHGLWQNHFGGDSAILGQRVRLNTESFAIVGVLPPSFALPREDIQLWVPLGPPAEWMLNRSVHVFRTIGRLQRGVSREEAATELHDLSRSLDRDNPGADPGHQLGARPLRQAMTGSVRNTLVMMLTAVTFVLLLACTTLSGLTLIRAQGRGAEFALRKALGATGGRLTRQLLSEGVALAILGGVLGLILAMVGLPRILESLASDLPRGREIRLDRRVLGFTLLITLGTGLILGVVPAIRAGNTSLRGWLVGSGGRSVGPPRQLAQSGLVVVQMAICLVLITGATLLVRSFKAAQDVEPGFGPEGLVTFTLSIQSSNPDPDRNRRLFRQLPSLLTSVPGVSAASATSTLPISGGDGSGAITVEGQIFPPGTEATASFRRVLPNYFSTMGIPLLHGRPFTDADGGGGDLVVIISASMAARYWSPGQAIGRRIKVGPPENEPWLTVVGVVADVHNAGLEISPGYDTYEPHWQRPRSTMQAVLRSQSPPPVLEPVVRRTLKQLDPELSAWGFTTMEQRIARSLAPRRFTTTVLGGFGLVALVLAVIGVYGVTASRVANSRREFGIRIALGAQPSAIGGLVVKQGIMLAGLGIAVGLPAALLLSGLVREMFFRVSATSFWAYALPAGLLICTTMVAAAIPAVRAIRVSPMTTLREE